jgi:hypothetical protein
MQASATTRHQPLPAVEADAWRPHVDDRRVAELDGVALLLGAGRDARIFASCARFIATTRSAV